MFLKVFLLTIFSFSLIKNASAQTIGLDPDRPDRGIMVDHSDPAKTLGFVIQNVIVLFFTMGALGFIIMFLWGAVDWILSGGDKEKIAGARKRITTSIIGLVLLSLTFVVMFTLGQILGLKSLYSFQFDIPTLLKQ